MSTETTLNTSTKSESAPVVPLFGMPKFDMPTMEIPPAFREFAEKGVAQSKEAFEKVKAAAEEHNKMLESVYSTASKGATEYGQKVIEMTRANTNTAFDFFDSLFGVKSPAELMELSMTHARAHFEKLSGQGKELAALAQKLATETAEPIKSGVEKAMKKVA